MVTIKTRLDNDDHYDGGNTKEYIVVHDTGNKTDSDEGNANYFCTGSRQASAHYFVDDDSITQVVKDDDCSWHCGDGGNKYGIGNRNSIGIEQCRVNGVVTAKTQANTLELIVMLMKKYGIPEEKVVRHYDASRKNCPASFNLDGKWTRWYEFKKQLHTMLNPVVVKPSGTLYRVRLSKDDVKSQKGAYTVLQSAIDCAKDNAGYEVYDPNGTQVYPPIYTAHYGVVTADVLNVRSGRGTNYAVIGQLTKGTKIRIDQLMGDWYSIYYGSHGGFVSAQYLNRL